MSRSLKFRIGSFNFNINVKTDAGFAIANLKKESYLAEAEATRQQAIVNHSTLNLFN